MWRYLICLGLLAGCNYQKVHQSEGAVAVHPKSAQPMVTLVPLFDRTAETDPALNLSQELTSTLRTRLLEREKLSLVGEQKIHAATKKLENHFDPFSPDLSWMKKVFKEDEFVVFMELLQHEEMAPAAAKTAQSPVELNMSMKVRVVDMRGKTPEVVLHEIIQKAERIPNAFSRGNFAQGLSSLGLAQGKFMKLVAQRVEDYILLAAND